MNISQLMKDRGVGFLTITFTRTYGDSLQTVISRMGFDIPAAELRATDAVEAEAALLKLFSRDLASGEKVMDTDIASRYASDLIAECTGTEAKIFTNARWEGETLVGWNPVTKATFNILILIMSTDVAVSVLVEDED